MQDTKGVEFDENIHKTKKNGEPLIMRGSFVVDKTKQQEEVIADSEAVQDTEFTVNDLPDTALQLLRDNGVQVRIDGHIAHLRKGSLETCVSFAHPDAAINRAVRIFCYTRPMTKQQLGAAEHESTDF